MRKVYAPDDSTIAICISKRTSKKIPKIPDDILAKLAHVG